MAHKVVAVASQLDRSQQHMRGLLDHRIALEEAIGVVVGLEVIKVAIADGKGLVILDSAADGLLDRDIRRAGASRIRAALELAAAERGAHAREQLGRREWLGDSSRRRPAASRALLGGAIARREQDDRRQRAGCPRA